MKPRSNRLAALVAAGVLTVTLGACGSDGDAPEVLEPGTTTAAPEASDGATATGEAAPETGEDTGTAAAPAEGEELTPEEFMARIKAPGDEQLGSFTVQMNLGAQGQEMVMEGAADLRGDTPLMELSMDMPGMGSVDILLVEGEVFMTVPGVTEEGQYMRMNPADLGMDLEELTGSIDMEGTFDAWDAGTQKVTFVGTEDVEGEQLEHYQLEVDAAAASDASGETMEPGLPDLITYDVWLDPEGLMRKVTFEMEGMTAEMLVDNWGEDVDIQVPDESQIVEFTF